LVGEGKVFNKDEAEVASKVAVVCLDALLFESNGYEFSLGGIES